MLIDSIKRNKFFLSFVILAVLLVAIAFAGRLAENNAGQSEVGPAAVTLLRASDYRHAATVDLNNGIVESLGQADLKVQIPAPIEQINVKLGDMVAAGQTLVQLQNSDIKAQLQQAQAGLAAAQARLDELQRGSRAEDIAISETSYEESRMSLINSVKDSYAKSDDAIHNHIDKFFLNPRESSVEFGIEITISGSGKTVFKAGDPDTAARVEKQKSELESMFGDWQTVISDLDSDSTDKNLAAALSISKSNLQKEIDFLNGMAPLVNNLSTDNASLKNIIDGYKTEFSAARSAISGSLASLQMAETAWKSAQKALDLKLSGSSAEQIEQGKAAVAQALAGVNAIKVTLAKTSISSPIAGKVSYINGSVGEYAAAGTLIVSVVNPDALRVKAYASENDLADISEGAPVTIRENGTGVVEAVAPAVDSQTKKAQVDILVTDSGNPAIIVGQNVNIKIAANNPDRRQYFLLPIEAVQFTGTETYTLEVDQNSTLSKVPVATGPVVGEKIYVTSGLNENSSIVSSVRGLQPGQAVEVR